MLVLGFVTLMVAMYIAAGVSRNGWLASTVTWAFTLILFLLAVVIFSTSPSILATEDTAERYAIVAGATSMPIILSAIVAAIWRVFSPMRISQRLIKMAGPVMFFTVFFLSGALSIKFGISGAVGYNGILYAAVFVFSIAHIAVARRNKRQPAGSGYWD